MLTTESNARLMRAEMDKALEDIYANLKGAELQAFKTGFQIGWKTELVLLSSQADFNLKRGEVR